MEVYDRTRLSLPDGTYDGLDSRGNKYNGRYTVDSDGDECTVETRIDRDGKEYTASEKIK